jgi:hypothetical protein
MKVVQQSVPDDLRAYGLIKSGLDEKAKLTDLPFTDVTQSLGTVSKKIVRRVSTSEYGVFSRKPSKQGSTYMRFGQGSGYGAAADSQNAGGSWDLFRLIGIRPGSLLHHPNYFQQERMIFKQLIFATDYASPSTHSILFKQWYEMRCKLPTLNLPSTIKKSHNGVLELAFLGTGKFMC